MDSHPSTARRPYKSPAHTVKDQSLAALSSEPPQYISSRVSRPFYIPSCFRQHPKSKKLSVDFSGNLREGQSRRRGRDYSASQRFCEGAKARSAQNFREQPRWAGSQTEISGTITATDARTKLTIPAGAGETWAGRHQGFRQ